MKLSVLSTVVLAAAPLVASPLPPKSDLFAQNTVVAQYLGSQKIYRILCSMDWHDTGRSSLAHSNAAFYIIKNEAYFKNEAYCKPGYGDCKLEEGGIICINAQDDLPGEPAEVYQELQKLTPGETLRLTITHYYLNRDLVSDPVRRVTALERLAPPAAGAPAPELPSAPNEGVMPITEP